MSFDDSSTTDDVESGIYSEEESMQPPRMRWLYVLAIGLGFFTTGVSWDVYDSYLPADFLADYITGEFALTLIALVMVLDNILALLLQPYIGARSDSTRTKWGRRMPYIMIGTPIAALFFTLIAYGWAIFGLFFMLVVLTIFNIAMAFYRAPVVALMPDLIPSEHRSKANGVINLMGGIGAIYAFGIASQIYKINDPNIGAILGVTAEQSGPILTFLTSSIIMIVALCILIVSVKEPPVPVDDPNKVPEIGILEAFRQVSFHEDRSALAILSAIFMWFFGYHAMKTWFTTYGNQIWGFETADASFLLTGMALSFVIFAVPAGFIAGKIGRRNTILVGLVGFIVCLVFLALVSEYMILLIILAIAGVFWAMVNINSIVLVWEMLGQSRLGAGTGLYYGFQMTAAIFGPLVAGFIFDLTSIAIMFPLAIIFQILALVLTSTVKTGEVGDKAIS